MRGAYTLFWSLGCAPPPRRRGSASRGEQGRARTRRRLLRRSRPRARQLGVVSGRCLPTVTMVLNYRTGASSLARGNGQLDSRASAPRLLRRGAFFLGIERFAGANARLSRAASARALPQPVLRELWLELVGIADRSRVGAVMLRGTRRLESPVGVGDRPWVNAERHLLAVAASMCDFLRQTEETARGCAEVNQLSSRANERSKVSVR